MLKCRNGSRYCGERLCVYGSVMSNLDRGDPLQHGVRSYSIDLIMTGFNYSRLSDENKAVVDHLPLEYLEHLYSLKCRQRKRFLNLCRTGLAGHSREGHLELTRYLELSLLKAGWHHPQPSKCSRPSPSIPTSWYRLEALSPRCDVRTLTSEPVREPGRGLDLCHSICLRLLS